ncbi:Similar to GLO5: Peroxisomal (S)-2-hydroxy-acid oxidase GLO5 (Arabidopsis thaliana) [Cotesia congregata]|uniref:(S)-2-hydroxy-acid oxidase n=1 Tax=Cotesia congregata TaxID=51543 RepID=A0A8J2MNM1_COTCN|nr:Similar to GLO5: Peroxisomal (S)-2-hydroxy-acid oxidase GLO5 (Arabidopsis thaliana) [Cotesia congregata]
MDNFVSVDDFEKSALQILPKAVKDYYASGAGKEFTLEWNKDAFKKYKIRPKVLTNVLKCEIGTRILGEEISMPLGIAPTAMQGMAHPDGECATAEEISKAAPNAIKWFQLYVFSNRQVTINLIRRVERAGYKAIVLTIDTPFFGVRRRDVKNKFSLPRHLKLANFDGHLSSKINSADSGSGLNEYAVDQFDRSLSWDDIDWLQSITNLPIILKGILRADDALAAVKKRVQGIIVSNHGARQLDTVPASIEALPEIVKAVGDKIDVYLDSGIRQGTDVFKALALGAKMVFIGRPILWGLTHGGVEGAIAILKLMEQEIKQTLALAGCRSVDEVTGDMIVHESHYSRL